MGLIALTFLSRSNARRAEQRGKSKKAAIAYTIIIWTVFGLIGSLIGIMLFDFSLMAYVLSLITASIGGVLSYIISKQGSVTNKHDVIPDLLINHGVVIDKTGEALYYDPKHHELAAPCTVRINYEISPQDSTSTLHFTLNGKLLFQTALC